MSDALVLLHGFTHTGRSWGPVMRELGERYRAIAPDIRGHGAAAEIEPVELDAVVDDVVSLGGSRFTLAGYSMGGRIALHVAVRHPERLRRLLLVGASPGIEDDAERADRRTADEALAAELETSSIEAFAARWAQTPVLAGAPAEVAATAHADRLRNTPPGLARALRGLGTGTLPSLWPQLPHLMVPVTLVVGERDTKFQAIARAMAAGLPDAQVVVVPGAGHAVHLEQPSAVARALAG